MVKTIITEQYSLLEQLGQGGNAITYKAEDQVNSQLVAVKILSLEQIDDWKKLDYFEREVQILQQLDHPHIPNYIDYLVKDSQSDHYYHLSSEQSFQNLLNQGIQPNRFYLVQELIEGKSFFQLIEEGWKPDEQEVKKIAQQILEILIYLQQLIPPVTHRDIKPHNLIYTENREVFLVDFGAVQDKVRQTTVGSSVVGTYGYMAPEQFRGGKTYASTDLYGLGTTLIYLLTGKHPTDFPQKKLKVDYHKQVQISHYFRQWLDKLIEPFPEKRLPSAQVALEVLDGKLNLAEQINDVIEKPRHSKIKLTKTSNKLIINIPCALTRKGWNYKLVWLAVIWTLLVFLALLYMSQLSYFTAWHLICIFYALILIEKKIISNKKVIRLYKKESVLVITRILGTILSLVFLLSIVAFSQIIELSHGIYILFYTIIVLRTVRQHQKELDFLWTKIVRGVLSSVFLSLVFLHFIPLMLASTLSLITLLAFLILLLDLLSGEWLGATIFGNLFGNFQVIILKSENLIAQKLSLEQTLSLLISPSEKIWLCQEIKQFLKS